VVETESHPFPEKQIATLSPAALIKLSAIEHVSSHHFSFLPSHLSLLHYYSLRHYCTTLDG
jgi:hypothetical protein